MLPEMADEASAARSALAYLGQLQPDLRAAALFDAEGRLIEHTGDRDAWLKAGTTLLGELDRAAKGTAAEAHVATPSGEVFMVAGDGRRLLAVAERFVLASLFSFDMRTVLRELEGAADAA